MRPPSEAGGRSLARCRRRGNDFSSLGGSGWGQEGGPDPSSIVAVWLLPDESTHSTLTLSFGEYFTSACVSCDADVIVVPSMPTMVSPAWMPAWSAPEPDCTSVTAAPLLLPPSA